MPPRPTALAFATALALVSSTFGATPAENDTVEVSAVVQEGPTQITLNWTQRSTTNSYTIYRRTTGPGTAWGSAVATLPGTATTWTDDTVEAGVEYEYHLRRANAHGYLRSGIRAPLKDQWGKLILLVDDTMVAPLTAELLDLERMLVGDGWQVVRRDVSRTATPPEVKAIITGLYAQDPTNTRALFLFGHIPVPYSGSIYPDGHSNHRGAWPADVYYADVDGTWTDSTVTITSASHSGDPTRNHNRPDDGKFDQNRAPSAVELEFGRVDLSNLPRLAALGTETELLRNYIRKERRFRFAKFRPARRAILYGREFDWKSFRPSSDCLRESAAFFGLGTLKQVERYELLPNLQTGSYLWAHGDGGGHFQGAKGVATTSHFTGFYDATSADYHIFYDPLCPFFTTFGSWFGDWDTEDNFLRAFLAAPTGGLTNIWAGGNHWFAQDLTLGYNVGRPARLLHNNENNSTSGYTVGFDDTTFNSRKESVHMVLMGDPTLRPFVVAPPKNVTVTTDGALTWEAADDTAIVGYHIYWAAEELGPYLRLTTEPVTDCAYHDSGASGEGWYMVRAIKLETTGSGSFFNPSQGIMVPARSPETLVEQEPDNQWTLRWPGSPGRHYRVEHSADLQGWTRESGELPGAGVLLEASLAADTHRAFWRIVSADRQFFALAYPTPPDAEANAAFATLAPTLIFAPEGEPVSYALVHGAFPLGLSLDPATGEISGTPTEVGAHSVTIRASTGGLDADTVVRIAVVAPSAVL